MNVGLLIVRVIVGAVLFGHGAQKLFGWFGGYGLKGTGGFFESLGYRPGRIMALAAGLGEAAGALLALGLLTPLGAAAAVGVMLNAIVAVHWEKGFWNTAGGIEFPLVLACVSAGLGFSGPGRYSVDHLLGIAWSPWWGVAAVAVGLVSAAVVLGLRRRNVGAAERHLQAAA